MVEAGDLDRQSQRYPSSVQAQIDEAFQKLKGAELALTNINQIIGNNYSDQFENIGNNATVSQVNTLNRKITELQTELKDLIQKHENSERDWAFERSRFEKEIRQLQERNEFLESELTESKRNSGKGTLPRNKSPELIALSQSTSFDFKDIDQLEDENNDNEQRDGQIIGNPDDTMLSTSSTPESSPSKQANVMRFKSRSSFLHSRLQSDNINTKVLRTSTTSSNEDNIKDEQAMRILSQGSFSLSQPRNKIELLLKDENKENWGYAKQYENVDEPTISDSEPEYEDITDLVSSPRRVPRGKHSTEEEEEEEEGEEFSSEDESVYFDTNEAISQLLDTRRRQQSQKGDMVNNDNNVLDFTKNPIKNRDWFPEDFKINPITNFNKEFAFKHRKLDPKFVHSAINEQYEFSKKYNQEQVMSAFNELSGGDPSLPSPNMSMVWNTPAGIKTKATTLQQQHTSSSSMTKNPLMTPLRTPVSALKDPKIDPVFKFNIDSTTIPGLAKSNTVTPNQTRYQSVFADPNNTILPSVKSRTIKLWERPPSPPGFSRSDFPSTQEREADKHESLRLGKIKSLKRLFQAVMMVKPASNEDGDGDEVLRHNKNSSNHDDCEVSCSVYQQVGKFVFKNEELNNAIRENRFTIDESIFYDHTNIN